MPNILIEPFQRQTADQVFALLLPIQRDEFGIAVTRDEQSDIETIPAYYQSGLGNFWVALANDEVVGTIALKDIGHGQVALRKMFVHKAYRGKEKAVAQRLLANALSWAKDKNVSDIFLGTTEKFVAAHRFYEKNSFREIAAPDLPPQFPLMAVDSKFYHHRVELSNDGPMK